MRSKIEYIDQEPLLFTNTIRYNITLGKNFTDSDIIKACQKAKIYWFIKK